MEAEKSIIQIGAFKNGIAVHLRRSYWLSNDTAV